MGIFSKDYSVQVFKQAFLQNEIRKSQEKSKKTGQLLPMVIQQMEPSMQILGLKEESLKGIFL